MKTGILTFVLTAIIVFFSVISPSFSQSVPAPASQQLPPGEWMVLAQDGYLIYHEGADQSAANDLLEMYNRFDDEFSGNLGLEVPRGIRVFIAPTEGRFRLLTRGLPHWTGGLAKPSQKMIILQSPRVMPSRGQFSVTALHELVHILTSHEKPGFLPRWFSEGLAMYLSGETMYKNRTPLGRAVVFNKTYTLDGINNMMALGPEQARIAYMQSISFIEFLVEHYGWDSVAALLHGYQEGRDPNDVFREIAGRSFFDIEVAYHQELADKYRWFNILAWLNFDTFLWSGASLLVMAVGIRAIIQRRRYLHSDGDDEPIDESLADPRLYSGDPNWDNDDGPSAESFMEEDDEPWK
jgi:Peptidase MA superfamily